MRGHVKTQPHGGGCCMIKRLAAKCVTLKKMEFRLIIINVVKGKDRHPDPEP